MLMVILYFLFPDADANNSVTLITSYKLYLQILFWPLQSNAYAEDFEQDEQPTPASFKEVKEIIL